MAQEESAPMNHTQKRHKKHQKGQASGEGRAHAAFPLSEEDRWEPTAKGLVGAMIFDLQQFLEPANQARRDLNEQEQREVLSRLETVKWMLTKIKSQQKGDREHHATQQEPSPAHD